MRAVRLAVMLLAVCGAVTARAEETMAVVDDTGAVLGPVVGAGCAPSESWTCGWRRTTFLYRQGSGVALLMTDTPTVIVDPGNGTPAMIYFESSDCSGTTGVVQPADCCGTLLMPWIRLAVTDLWEVDSTTSSAQILASSQRALGSSSPARPCLQIPQSPVIGNPATHWGTLTFTPPLRVILNPTIFQDGFQTGDLSQWSNY